MPRNSANLDHEGAWLPLVVRQELAREHEIVVSLRTVERAVQELRRELVAEAKATIRFETPPGRQLQINFGSTTVVIAGEPERVFLFVATLGFSRRGFVAAFRHERQSAWLDGLERAFQHFGGMPEELLLDNAKALVTHHDPRTREVVFNDRFHAFCRYWASGRGPVRPTARRPSRSRARRRLCEGQRHRRRDFASWAALEAHLVHWTREVADRRVHGTIGEAPIERFHRDEAAALRPLPARPPFRQFREVMRRVHGDGCIDLDTNHYSVPWRLIGSSVTARIEAGEVLILHAGAEVARHAERRGRRERAVDRAHLAGVIARELKDAITPAGVLRPAPGELLQPLAEYEQAVGGLVSVAPYHLPGRLTQLGLKSMRDRLDSLLDEAGRRDLSIRDALDLLCEAEFRHREERRIQMGLGIAKFPFVRTLDGFEFDAQPSLDPKQIRDLATCLWIANGDTLLLLGPPGVG